MPSIIVLYQYYSDTDSQSDVQAWGTLPLVQKVEVVDIGII